MPESSSAKEMFAGESSVGDFIRNRLTESFAPAHLEVIDDSARHKGHAGAREGGQSHFQVTIVASCFADKSRLERHRMVMKALEEALAGPVHALGLDILTPQEHDRRSLV
ncbi:MAG: BolA family protein [Parvularculales bacterium]